MAHHVGIQTFEPATNQSIASVRIKIIDWNNRLDRRWLNQHLHWAVNNGATVKIGLAPNAA